jgi:hypothetical protein
MNEKPTDLIIKKAQKTNTGIYVTAGDIEHSDYDTKSWSDLQKDYTHMRDGHAIVSTTIDILKFPILMSEYKVESENKEAEDYVYWVYKNLYKGFDYLRRHKMLALDFGLQMHEVIMKRGDKFNGKLTNRPVSFNPILNETINRFHYDEQTRFIGIEHEKRTPEMGSDYIDIYNTKNNKLIGEPQWNLEYFSYNEEYNDIRGRAMLRPVRYFWDAELKILNASVTNIQRGAGIPVIYTKGEPGGDQAKIQEIGRTIAQMRNGYVSMNEERLRLELMEPSGQQNIMPMLEWLDGKLFFNTMSQFMISGIGSNGSRAATSEHKSSYELQANYVLQSLETNFQEMTDKIIRHSYLAKIPAKEYPKFSFNAITQADLQKVAGNLKVLMDSSLITKQRKDEEAFRDMFGLPTLDVSTKISDPNKKPVSIFGDKKEDSVDNVKLSKEDKPERKVSLDILDFEKRVFSLDSANEHYTTVEEQTEALMTRKYNALIDDIITQLSKDRHKTIAVRNSLIEETIDEFMKIYEKGYNRGERDIKSEFKKIGGDSDTSKLALDKKTFDKKRGIISKLIKKLFMNTKTSVEIKMDSVSDKFIENKGGIKSYLEPWKDGFKKNKRSIKSNTYSGYIDGRGETLLDLKPEVETYLYSSILNASTCNQCAPFDGEILTADEIEENGLNLNQSPVNPNCLGVEHSGENVCKCTITAYKLKSK